MSFVLKMEVHRCLAIVDCTPAMVVAYQRPSEEEGLEGPSGVTYQTFDSETSKLATASIHRFIQRRFFCELRLRPDLQSCGQVVPHAQP